jgi:hypothetical protein
MYAYSANPPRRTTVGTDGAVAAAAATAAPTTAVPLESLVGADVAASAQRPVLASDRHAHEQHAAQCAPGQTYSFARGIIPDAATVTYNIRTEYMLKQRQCRRCNALYHEYENIGAWRCHAHRAEYDSRLGVFPCCQTNSPVGCVSLDHAEDLAHPYPNSTSELSVGGALPMFRVLKLCLGQLRDVQPTALRHNPERTNDEYVWVLRRNPWGQVEPSGSGGGAPAAAMKVTGQESLPNKF